MWRLIGIVTAALVIAVAVTAYLRAQAPDAPGATAPNPAPETKPAAAAEGTPAPTQSKPPAPAETKPEPAPAAKPEPPTPGRLSGDRICRTIEEAAADNELPVEFFTRLIWQESRFDPNAVSRAGAQGIAQFMPSTASFRGLLDPFDPIEALRESAAYLAELRKTFGNLGLAAAAYNAGPGRLSRFLAGRSGLPGETRAYVRIVTGRSVEEWAAPTPPKWDGAAIPSGVPCAQLANLIGRTPRTQPHVNPNWKPWGVQLAGNWSEGRVLATYEQIRRRYESVIGDREPLILHSRTSGMGAAMRFAVRISEDNRQDAEKLCTRLRQIGGACVVLKNPRS